MVGSPFHVAVGVPFLVAISTLALNRDARAPLNLTPIAGLERYLHRLQGDARLALRALREVVLERNRGGRTA